MGRYLKLWLAQMRYSLVREMQFKANFLLWIVVELVWFVMQLVFVDVLYRNVDAVAGWTRNEMMLLMGANFFVQQVFQAFLMINCFNLPEHVRTGKLDFYLAQPVSPQFLLSTRLFEPGAVVNAAIGAAWCVKAMHDLGRPVTVEGAALFLFWSGCGILVHYSLLLFLVTLSFWIVRSQGLVYGYYQMFQIARLPRSAVKGVFRLIFTFALPMLLVANVPSEALLGRPDFAAGLLLVVLTGVLLGGSSLFFRFGLSRYTSASS